MTMLSLIIVGIAALYALASLLLWYGFQRAKPQRVAHQPPVSVLIAARNEEKNLPRCLQSLLRSEYPTDKFEILVIDDRSTDQTCAVAERWARQYPQIRVIAIQQRLENLSGKASALCQGMAYAHGEIILFTDADCEVPSSWIAQMASYFAPSVGLVGGVTLLASPGGKSALFVKIQNLDWLYLLTAGAGAAGLGIPLSIIGNNFAIRRAAYDAVGGYQKIGFSIIEDFALMRAIHTQTPWQIIFPLAPQIAITTAPAATWRAYYAQRQRWAAGGKEVGFWAKAFMGIAFLGHLACLVAGFISFPLVGLCGLMLASADFLLLWRSARALGRRQFLAVFPLFELYYFLYSFFFAPTVLFPATVRWKGTQYHWNLRGKLQRVQEPQ